MSPLHDLLMERKMLSVTMMILGATKLTSHSNFRTFKILRYHISHGTIYMWYKYMQFLVEIVIGPNCNNFWAFEFATYVVAFILEHPRHMFDGGCLSVHINVSDPKWHKTAPHVFCQKFQFQLSWWLWWWWWERECERGREQPDWCRQELCLSCLETFSINARVLQKSELLHCLASIVKWNASLWSEYTWALSLAPIKGNIAQPCLSEVKYKSDCTAVYCQASCLLWNAIVLQCKCRADSTIARLDSTDGCLSTTHCSWAQNVGGKEMVEK